MDIITQTKEEKTWSKTNHHPRKNQTQKTAVSHPAMANMQNSN